MIHKQNVTIISLIVIFLNVVTVYSQNHAVCDSNSSQCCGEIKNLNLRIDSLEARMECLQIQFTESDPFKSGKYLLWGRGLTFGIVKSEPRISFDAGYTFSTAKSFRMSIAAGFDAELGASTVLPDYGFYGKVNYGTPVFVNFISINGYARTLFYPKDAQEAGHEARGGYGAGADLEFWLAPSWCYTCGGSITFIDGGNKRPSRKITEINFIGFKYYPQVKGKRR